LNRYFTLFYVEHLALFISHIEDMLGRNGTDKNLGLSGF